MFKDFLLFLLKYPLISYISVLVLAVIVYIIVGKYAFKHYSLSCSFPEIYALIAFALTIIIGIISLRTLDFLYVSL